MTYFEASNTVGKVREGLFGDGRGLAPGIEFSNEEETISCLPGEEVLRHHGHGRPGTSDAVHEWKVGGRRRSTAEFKQYHA